MKLPRLGLQATFGKATQPSRSYDEICALYIAKLTAGGQASGRYLPEQDASSESAKERKKDLLTVWARESEELVSTVQNWSDEDLDAYQLPHPLLGNLTVREMLYFTIYHNLRHARREGD